MIGLVGIVALVGFGCQSAAKPTTQQKQVIDHTAILLDAKKQGLIMDTGEIEHMNDPAVRVVDEKKETTPDWATFTATDFRTWQAAALADITGGTSYGISHLQFLGNEFRIAATFGDLSTPTDGSELHAWLVRRGDGMKVVDLGKLIPADKLMVLTYASKTDLSEYDFFVVTLQAPNSTDPGEHILEGTIR